MAKVTVFTFVAGAPPLLGLAAAFIAGLIQIVAGSRWSGKIIRLLPDPVAPVLSSSMMECASAFWGNASAFVLGM